MQCFKLPFLVGFEAGACELFKFWYDLNIVVLLGLATGRRESFFFNKQLIKQQEKIKIKKNLTRLILN